VDHGYQFVTKGSKTVTLPFSIACEAENPAGLPCWVRTPAQKPVQIQIPAMGGGSISVDGIRLTWVRSTAGSQERILTFSEQNESAVPVRVGSGPGDALVFTDTLFRARREADHEQSSIQLASLPIGGMFLFGKSGTNVVGVDSRVNGDPLATLTPLTRVLPVRSVMPLRRIELAATLPIRNTTASRLNDLIPVFLVLAVLAAMLAVGMSQKRSEQS